MVECWECELMKPEFDNGLCRECYDRLIEEDVRLHAKFYGFSEGGDE